MAIRNTSEYKKMSREEVLGHLETTEEGLKSKEADSRLQQFGYNEIQEIRRNPVLEFLKRYWGPMPWLLEISIVLTLVLNHYTESVIIFTLLTINAVIGSLQSRNSHKAVEMLKKKLDIKSKVLRNKEWVLLDAREIVPGDILMLKLGDLVPADAYLLEGELLVDQSALTGESMPVNAAPSDIIYSGTIVKRGEAKCAAMNTGANTYFGKTAELVKVAKPKSKQEELMLTIVKYMMYLGIGASAVVSAYGIYLHKDILFILSFIVIFLIGAIPVALPAVLTIVQAAGAMELSRKGVLVTKLDCIEDAASIDMFCFDKTGTITQNRLSVVDCAAFGSYQKEEVIRLAAQASREEGMDLIDGAILSYAKESGFTPDYEKLVRFIPFSPETKRTEAVMGDDGKEIRIMKGAVPTILALCSCTD
ncbi:MAG: HAD-IC family P-type ATPase, partial [Lacrimispora sp.]